LQIPTWLSAASDARSCKNALTNRRKYPNSSPEAREAVPKVPEEVEGGIHAALIAGEASDGNLA